MNNRCKPSSELPSMPPFVTSKVNQAIPKVNRAKAQSRHSGILLAQANGKLYFEFLKSISVPQNHLPRKGEVRYSEVMRPFQLKMKNYELRERKAQYFCLLIFNS